MFSVECFLSNFVCSLYFFLLKIIIIEAINIVETVRLSTCSTSIIKGNYTLKQVCYLIF